MAWYAAHALVAIRVDPPLDSIPVYENVLLVEADDDESANTKAEIAARDEYRDLGGVTCDGRPARQEYLGLRKLVTLKGGRMDPRPGPLEHGDELTYWHYEVENEAALGRLLQGRSVRLELEDARRLEEQDD